MSWSSIVLIVAAGLAVNAALTAVAIRSLLRLPVDFFERVGEVRRIPLPIKVLRNVAGGLIIVAGVILSLPGVPGPGVAVALIGVFTLEFDGKHHLVRRVLRRPHALAVINRIRRRFKREPLHIPPV